MAPNSPVTFAKSLSDPLQPNRLQALKSLKSWMDRWGSTYEFSSEEIDQLWRALQLSLWMADKREVQQQVAADTVLFIRKIDPVYVVEWNRGFWFNIEKIYETVDKYRIPKIHLLIRIYVAELFHQMSHRSWNQDFVAACSAGIVENLHRAVGAYIQFLTVFLPELEATVSDSSSLKSAIKSSATFKALLNPVMNVVHKGDDIPLSVLGKAIEGVLSNEKVVGFSPIVRNWMKSEIQQIAMAQETSQDVRDKLYGCLDLMDAIPAKPIVKKRKSSDLVEKQPKTKKPVRA